LNITGPKERTTQMLLAQIRKQYQKKKEDFILIDEFSEFTGLVAEKVRKFLIN
jgi:archaellum biogenesis ATPase FlaH